MALSADRALTLRATLSRIALALRADDRSFRIAEIVERITALGGIIAISETHVWLEIDNGEIEVSCARRHVDWALTLQACVNTAIERTLEVSE